MASAASAGPFINPGLMSIPTAYTLPFTAIKLGYSGSFFLGMQPTDPEINDYYDISLSGGLEFWDIGVELTFAAYDFDSSAYVGAAEVRFIPETVKFPAVAIGMRNIGGDVDVSPFGAPGVPGGSTVYLPEGRTRTWFEQFTAYVVFSKDFYPALAIPIRGHIGLGTGAFQGMYASKYTDSSTWQGVFGAIEYQVRYDFSLALEVNGRDLNFGVLYKLPWWGMEIGVSVDKLEMLFYSEDEVLRTGGGQVNEFDQVGLGIHFGVQFGPFVGPSDFKKQELIKERIERGREQLEEIKTRRQELQQRLAEVREEITKEKERSGDE
ncbi:MAG TPA: hypothetical protein VM054_06860 [bacterium]|nr:hypothetical protein [bacterium]